MNYIQNVNILSNIFWQKGVIKVLFLKKIETAIFLGDMKILSNWAGILIYKLRRKKLHFGHTEFMEMKME